MMFIKASSVYLSAFLPAAEEVSAVGQTALLVMRVPVRVGDVEDSQGLVGVVPLDPGLGGGQLGDLPQVDRVTARGRHRVAPLVHGIVLKPFDCKGKSNQFILLTGLSQASPNIKPQMFSGD